MDTVFFKKALIATTALMSFVLAFPAAAVTYTVSTPTTTVQPLASGDNLDVTSSGSIAPVTGPATTVTNVAAGTITNAGTLLANTAAIGIDGTGGDLTGGIVNLSTGVISGFRASPPLSHIYGIAVGYGGDISGGVDNAGLISGTTNAFYVLESSISGGILNRAGATITASEDTALYLQRSNVSFIDNAGLISGNVSRSRSGIDITTFSTVGSLTNRAGGVINGYSGIDVDSAITGALDNAGTINGTNYALIVAEGGNIAGGILNTGTIAGTGPFGSGLGLLSGATLTGLIDNRNSISGAYGININTSTATAGILNSGTISGFGAGVNVTGAGGNLYRLENTATGVINRVTVSNGGDISQALLNNGSIGVLQSSTGGDISAVVTNNATINSLRNDGGDMSGGVINNGTIGNGAQGLSMLFGSDMSGGITNSAAGTISCNCSAINIDDASDLSGGVFNSGFISGIIGLDLRGAMSGGLNLLAGYIEGTGGTAVSFSTTATDAEINLQGGRIIGNVIDQNPGAGHSTVNVLSNFTSEGNFDISTLRVASGNTFTLDTGHTMDARTLAFDIENTGNHGLFAVNSGAIDLTGVNVRALLSMTSSVADGEEFMVADGTAPIIGGPGGVRVAITDNSALWNFEMADGTAASAATDDTDLFLFVTQAPPPPPGGGFSQEVIDALLAMGGSPDLGVQNAIDNVNNAPSQTVLQDVLASLQSRVNGGTQHGAKAFAEAAFGVTGDHLNKKSDETGVSTGDPWKALRAWGQVFGQTADQSARGGIGGFDADTAGFTLGLESETLFDSCVAGVSLSYGRTNVDNKSATNASNGSVDIDSYQLGLYGQADIGNRVYLRGMASYSFNANESARYNVGGAGGPTAVADFDASQYALRLETGRSYAAGYAVLTPSLMANVLHYSPDSYTETGAGGLNLNVRGKDVTIAELGVGVKAKWEYKQDDGSKFLPELHGGYRYDLVGDAVEATSAFTGGGGSFATTGSSPARSRLNFGAGLTYQTSSSWELHAGYDLDLKQDYHAHSGTVRASIRF
ncbi:MAG: autotransporter domain-containing protein [Alphaproteobacteria bacterium]